MMPIRRLAETGLLAAFLFVTGAVKLPGLLPGTEFQLSAPLAVAVCAVFGFRRYIIAGLIASSLGLMLGTQNFLHVFIAMIFRLTVGGVLATAGTSWLAVAVAGPIGSAVARLALAAVIGQVAAGLVLAAVPGMLCTALTAWPLTVLLKKVRLNTERVLTGVLQR